MNHSPCALQEDRMLARWRTVTTHFKVRAQFWVLCQVLLQMMLFLHLVVTTVVVVVVVVYVCFACASS